MTNEESTAAYESFLLSIDPRKDLFDVHMAYMNACNWKDEQFKEYLEKKRTYYSQALTTFDVMRKKVFDEIINELFKEQV